MQTVEHFFAAQNEMGETPIWVPEENALYWVDIPPHRIHRYEIENGKHEMFEPEVPVRGLTRRKGNRWLLIANNGAAFWERESHSCEFLLDPCAELDDRELNDGTIDRQGRFLAGSYNTVTHHAPDGAVYRMDADRSLHTLDDGIVLSNGMGFSPDGKTLYVSEMFAYKITAYDYDGENGTVSNRRVFVQFEESDGKPDGLTVDSEGGVWAAHWGGWQVTRHDPDGKLERRFRVPSEIVTSIGFGGTNMDELYITTAWFELTEQQRREQPQAGDLFRVQLDVKGLVEEEFAG